MVDTGAVFSNKKMHMTKSALSSFQHNLPPSRLGGFSGFVSPLRARIWPVILGVRPLPVMHWHDKNCLIPYNWAKYTFVPSAHSLLHFSGFSRFIRGTKVAASRAYKFIMPVMHRIYHASNAQLEEYCCPFQMMQAISADDEER
jgi:hypothetical protein